MTTGGELTVDDQLKLMAAQADAAIAATPMGQELRRSKFLWNLGAMYSRSDIVPKQYQGNEANCMIALDTAMRMELPALAVMQNLYVVHGVPAWSTKFLIATINTCGRYQTLRYECNGLKGDEYGWRCVTYERKDVAQAHPLEGPWVTWKMVKAEGWSSRNRSKWLTMPEMMFRYRAAAFWQRLFAPEVSFGMLTAEEAEDITDVQATEVKPRRSARDIRAELADRIAADVSAPRVSADTPTATTADGLFVDPDTGEVL